MTIIQIDVPDELSRRLEEVAVSHGTTVGDLLRETAEKWVVGRDGEFSAASDYVLNKNQELYRRLS